MKKKFIRKNIGPIFTNIYALQLAEHGLITSSLLCLFVCCVRADRNFVVDAAKNIKN